MKKVIGKILSVFVVFIFFFIGVVIGSDSTTTSAKESLEKEYTQEQNSLNEKNSELSKVDEDITTLNNHISELNNYIKDNSKN